ncbi:MAG: hypothetical protein ACREV5_02875 [Steroidobacter sp.]
MSVAGKWNVTMDTPIGTQKFEWDLQQAGDGWTGIMNGQAGKSDLSGIKVEGDAVGFETRVSSPMGAINLTFNGSVSGDQISGTCKTIYGNTQFTGQRG